MVWLRYTEAYELPASQLEWTELRSLSGYFIRTQGEIDVEVGFPKASTFQAQNPFYLVTSGEATYGG